MMKFIDTDKNVYIEAADLQIGDNFKYGTDINIKVRGLFKIGNNCVIGDRFSANAEELIIGDYFFNVPTDSRGMVIGGGSSNFPNAKLKIGNRMVCHTGHINLAEPVVIGDDVGLSHDVDIITHGFWASVLDGYPRNFSGVTIGNNVIVGWKSIIMSGVTISDDIVIGAGSTVTKSLSISKGIYAGTPAKFIKNIEEPTLFNQISMLDRIVTEFRNLLQSYEVGEVYIFTNYPYVEINDLKINVKEFTSDGNHDVVSDAFRDFLRRYGIRIFAPHGFLFKLKRK